MTSPLAATHFTSPLPAVRSCDVTDPLPCRDSVSFTTQRDRFHGNHWLRAEEKQDGRPIAFSEDNDTPPTVCCVQVHHTFLFLEIIGYTKFHT